MSFRFDSRRCLAALSVLALAAGGGCTQVQVQETPATFKNAVCPNDNTGGGQQSGGGGQQSGGGSQSLTTGMMDTYIVQIFELYEGSGTTQSACDTCMASRANCFVEEEKCVCGDPVAVSPARLPEMLHGLQVPVPAKYGSLYCMRIMAVERSSQSESCQCDSNWETRDKVRLCASSPPYAASPLPIELDVQCTNSRSFSTCLGSTP